VNKFSFTNPRWHVFSRIIAAIFGGYASATASSLFISLLLQPIAGKYQAIHIGLMLTFFVYACAVMWVFTVTSASRAWLGLFKFNAFLLIGTWLLLQVNS